MFVPRPLLSLPSLASFLFVKKGSKKNEMSSFRDQFVRDSVSHETDVQFPFVHSLYTLRHPLDVLHT